MELRKMETTSAEIFWLNPISLESVLAIMERVSAIRDTDRLSLDVDFQFLQAAAALNQHFHIASLG